MNARVFRDFILAGLMGVTGLSCLLVPSLADARIVHKERSLYSTILVDERGSLLCMQFSVRRDQRNQSCMDRNDPRKLVFGYAKMMLSSLLLNPEPRHILIVGLGGGTLPMALNELYPDVRIDVVEIDPAVKTVAETYFGFVESEKMRVLLQDGRVFTKRAVARGELYDLILLDAFNGDYIPEHLMTREYLEETRSLLTPDGVLVANTFAISQLYDHESVTYQAVFGEFFNVQEPSSANRIILTMIGDLPDVPTLQLRARQLAPRLLPYDLRVGSYPALYDARVNWDTEARVLTDQWSPANLLQGQ